jgi:hypothetical protein
MGLKKRIRSNTQDQRERMRGSDDDPARARLVLPAAPHLEEHLEQ